MIDSKINLATLSKIDGFSWPIQLALIDMFCRCVEPANALEIGTWHGRSGVILATYVNEKYGIYYGIEPDPQRADITYNNCGIVCPNGHVYVEKNISTNSQLLERHQPWLNIVHIDGEHTFNAVYNDLNIVKPLMLRDGIIILDDFFFDMYPQITQAVFKWLDQNPDWTLLCVGSCKGFLCNKISYKKYADMILDESFITELKKYDTYFTDISITKTSPISDCLTIGITTNISKDNYVGNECDSNGRVEKIVAI